MTIYEGPDDPEVLLNVLTFAIEDRELAERIKADMRESRRRNVNARTPIPNEDLRLQGDHR